MFAKLMSDTRFAAGLLALAFVCSTVLVAMGKVDFADAAKALGGMLFGAGAAWNRGAPQPETK